MKVSARTEYACLSMLELSAAYERGEPVRTGQIAERHQIPPQFLVQILLQLKGAGLVASTRGAAGGYQLLKPPEEISLADVMAVIEGPLEQWLPTGAAADSPASRVLVETWREIARREHEALAEITLAELVERVRHDAEHMYYI